MSDNNRSLSERLVDLRTRQLRLHLEHQKASAELEILFWESTIQISNLDDPNMKLYGKRKDIAIEEHRAARLRLERFDDDNYIVFEFPS